MKRSEINYEFSLLVFSKRIIICLKLSATLCSINMTDRFVITFINYVYRKVAFDFVSKKINM